MSVGESLVRAQANNLPTGVTGTRLGDACVITNRKSPTPGLTALFQRGCGGLVSSDGLGGSWG
jgi:hypothetical protein